MLNEVKHLAMFLAKSNCEILRFTQDDINKIGTKNGKKSCNYWFGHYQPCRKHSGRLLE